MKKIFKNSIFMFILGTILSTSICVIASGLLASDIKYKDTNVESALDNLYEKANSYKFKLVSDSNDSVRSTALVEFHENKYKYFKITKLIKDNNVGECYIASWSLNKSQDIIIELNQKYEILSSDDDYKLNSIMVYSNSKENVWSRCYAEVELYN